VALSINGGAPGTFGLDNHASTVGDQFNFGNVNAGDTLTFVLSVLAPPLSPPYIYSDPSLNGPYDYGTSGAGANHVYSTSAAAGQISSLIPAGTYVAFEDLPAGSSDWNYFDDTFVFVNTSVTAVPEASTVLAGALLLLPLGAGTIRILRRNRMG
jgi:hypothetical protein